MRSFLNYHLTLTALQHLELPSTASLSCLPLHRNALACASSLSPTGAANDVTWHVAGLVHSCKGWRRENLRGGGRAAVLRAVRAAGDKPTRVPIENQTRATLQMERLRGVVRCVCECVVGVEGWTGGGSQRVSGQDCEHDKNTAARTHVFDRDVSTTRLRASALTKRLRTPQYGAHDKAVVKHLQAMLGRAWLGGQPAVRALVTAYRGEPGSGGGGEGSHSSDVSSGMSSHGNDGSGGSDGGGGRGGSDGIGGSASERPRPQPPFRGSHSGSLAEIVAAIRSVVVGSVEAAGEAGGGRGDGTGGHREGLRCASGS